MLNTFFAENFNISYVIKKQFSLNFETIKEKKFYIFEICWTRFRYGAAHCVRIFIKEGTILQRFLSPFRVLLERLTGFQPVKKFPAFYGTRKFITAVTSAHHLSLS
jgi:hypothetical protein